MAAFNDNPKQAEKGDNRSGVATNNDEGVLRGVHSRESRSLKLVSIENNGVFMSSSKEANFEAILEDIDKAIASDIVKPNTIIVDATQNSLEIPSAQIYNLNKSGVLEVVGSNVQSMSLHISNTIAEEETLDSFELGWTESKDSQ